MSLTGRSGIDFEGIGYRAATYKAHGSVSAVYIASGFAGVEGLAVTLTGNGEAGLGSTGHVLLGKINKYERDHYVTVQDAGYTEFTGISGKLPEAGNWVAVDGTGLVSPVADGTTSKSRAVSVNSADYAVMVLIG